MILKATFVSLTLCTSLLAQGLVVLEGATPASLDVRILDEAQLATGAGPTLLQNITVQPIEISGRRASQELDGTVARVDSRNGVQRVELPGIGRIVAYSRQGGAFWGYLFVPLLGGAQVLLELPGVGVAGLTNPFADRIAVAENGVHAVIPLRGGATYHVFRLDGGTLANGQTTRTVAIPGGTVVPALMVGTTAAFTIANDRLLRFDLAAGGTTDLTPIPALTNPRMKDELAMSGDGSTVVFLYGDSNDTLRLYKATATDPTSTVLPPTAGKYEEPGYLPEGTGDLRLMLNHDASRLFFVQNRLRVGGNGGDESNLLDMTGVLPTLTITDDNHFQPWIGIHILPSFKGNTLVAAIGDANLMDWYKADLTPTGGTVVNMTGTGPVTMPFAEGTLTPSKVKLVGDTAFVTDVTTTAQTLRALDVGTAASTVLFQDLPTDLAVGSAIGISPDLYVPGAGDRIYSGLTGNLVGATPVGVRITPPLSTPFFGVTAAELTPNWSLVTFYAATGGVFFGPYIQNLEQMVLTPGGGMLISSPTELIYITLGRPYVFPPVPHQGVRVFLTGANG